jgi:hypothetical protein
MMNRQKVTPLVQSLMDAAQAALDKGWFVFPCRPSSKEPYKNPPGIESGKGGSLLATQDSSVLDIWRRNEPANPCVRLDFSGLTVLDADHGLSSWEDAEAWAKRNGIPETYTVSTGRSGGGYHFYFRGVRTLPDVTRNVSVGRVGFQLDGVSGDIKHHGHVVLEGGLHKSGVTYIGNGKPIAELPTFIRDYRDPKVIKQAERIRKIATSRAERMLDNIVLVAEKERHDHLLKDAGRLRYLGLEEQAIFLGLQDICRRFFEDGEAYALRPDVARMAKDIAAMSCDRRIKSSKSGIIIPVSPPSKTTLYEGFLCSEFAVGEVVSIQTIVGRIVAKFGSCAQTSLQRAMRAANFKKVGKQPEDKRVVLWIRLGEQIPKELYNFGRRFNPHSSG